MGKRVIELYIQQLQFHKLTFDNKVRNYKCTQAIGIFAGYNQQTI